MKTISITLAFLLITACQASAPNKAIFPDQIYQSIDWTTQERAKDITIRHLYRSETASTHLIRLAGSEFPHYHDRHDLNVSALSGTSIIHFEGHQVELLPGDTVFVPKGTYHWAENTDAEASVVFAVFSPGFDGKDRRKAK